MKTIVAALDNSLACRPVLAAASGLGSLLGAQVEALHVQTNGDRTVRSAAEAASMPLHLVSGAVVERLVEAGAGEKVVAVTIGARGAPSGERPLGGTAAAVAAALAKPVLVVPPEAHPPDQFGRVLVPLEASVSASLAPRVVFELARGAEIEAVALHVYDEQSLPRFTDQPQHEQSAWAKEFLARYCPAGLETVRLETRVGRSDELVPVVAEESACDLVALGWSQELAPGRAQVVLGTLRRSRLPVLLVPVRRIESDEPPENLAI
jgi:nucleotide-binding universal stress UspA family protein